MSRMGALRGSAVIAALGLSQAANAAVLSETLCRSAVNGVVAAVDVRSGLYGGVYPAAVDIDRDGTTSAAEVFANLSGDTCQNGRCKPDQKEKLEIARDKLAGFLEFHPGLEFVDLRAPTAAELQSEPDLATPLGRLLDTRGRFVAMRCSPAAPAPGPTTPVAALPPILVGKDLESLTAKRGASGKPDRLKTVKQAEVGWTNDREKNTKSVNIDGVVGLKLGSGTTSIIPFVQYVRAEVDDENAGTEKVTGKFGAGGLVSFMSGRSRIDIAPYFTKDLEHGSKLATLRIGWRPGFLYDVQTFRNAWHFACRRTPNGGCAPDTGLALVTDAQLIASFGTVLKEGDDPALTKGREFIRVGPSLTAQVYGLDGLFRDLSVDVSYKRLFRVSGDRERISSFKAGLNYWIAGSDHVSLRYGYEVGRDEDTLKEFDVSKLGIGVRF